LDDVKESCDNWRVGASNAAQEATNLRIQLNKIRTVLRVPESGQSSEVQK